MNFIKNKKEINYEKFSKIFYNMIKNQESVKNNNILNSCHSRFRKEIFRSQIWSAFNAFFLALYFYHVYVDNSVLFFLLGSIMFMCLYHSCSVTSHFSKLKKLIEDKDSNEKFVEFLRDKIYFSNKEGRYEDTYTIACSFIDKEKENEIIEKAKLF